MNGTDSSAGSGSESATMEGADPIPGLGNSFRSVQPDLLAAALNNARPSSSSSSAPAPHHSRKMKSFIKNRFSHHNNATNWSVMKTTISERKARLAANTNNTESLSRLLDSGVNPNSVDEFKRSALHFAAAKGYTEVVEILLRHGARPNLKDGLGNTPLHLAARKGYLAVVTALEKAGADLQALRNDIESALLPNPDLDGQISRAKSLTAMISCDQNGVGSAETEADAKRLGLTFKTFEHRGRNWLFKHPDALFDELFRQHDNIARPFA